MKVYFSAKPTVLWRTILLFGLVSGLLFSEAEGLRLLPFPASVVFHQSDSDWKNNGETNYEENLHRFETPPTKTQSKSQPDHKKPWLRIENPLKTLFANALANGQKKYFSVHQTFSLSHLLTKNIGNRAPPPA